MIAEPQTQDRYQQAILRAVQKNILTWRELAERLRACQLQEITRQGVLIVSVPSPADYWWLTHGNWGAWLGHVTGEHIHFVLESHHA